MLSLVLRNHDVTACDRFDDGTLRLDRRSALARQRGRNGRRGPSARWASRTRFPIQSAPVDGFRLRVGRCHPHSWVFKSICPTRVVPRRTDEMAETPNLGARVSIDTRRSQPPGSRGKTGQGRTYEGW